MEITWAFSIYLESVSMVPQMWMIHKSREVDLFTSQYLIAMGSYRALYIANWIYRFQTEGFYDLIAIVGGSVQVSKIEIIFLILFFLSETPSHFIFVSFYSNSADFTFL